MALSYAILWPFKCLRISASVGPCVLTGGTVIGPSLYAYIYTAAHAVWTLGLRRSKWLIVERAEGKLEPESL